ncbi:MAG: division/cell wall cluster transcriptional repressor MraZ [Parcubacteria group bacterium SW_6_46_9]|nr:MAG: division/cell wall cluster transcriptional repressor MraZ [Parcubacteria group bacterium SW_6_46_9]
MFTGEYTHTLDDKRRISVPSAFRGELDGEAVLTRGLDNCIFMFPQSSWEDIARKLSDLSFGDADSRGLNRFLLSGAREVSLDSSGRILVPDFLADFADLDETAVFAGVNTRIELWDKDRWDDYTEDVESQADLLAQTLGDVGML